MEKRKIFITGGDGEYLRMAEVMISSLKPFIGESKIRVYTFDCDYFIDGIECIRINLPYTPSFNQRDPINITQTCLASYWGKYHATIHSLKDFEYSVWIDSDCFLTKEINRVWDHCDRAKNINYPLFMHYFLSDTSYWFKMPNSEIEVSGKYGSEACHMFDIIRNPFGKLSAAGFYLAHRSHINFLKECLELRYESLKKYCYYYADDKAFSEERLTNVCMWKHGYDQFLPFTWINSLTEKNLDRFEDPSVKKLLLDGFDVVFDENDNSILAIHGPNNLNIEKNSENLKIAWSSFETDIDKIMIVAHPDDEIIFGGSALLQEKGWRVVCLTNGKNDVRLREIKKSLRKCGVIDHEIFSLEDQIDVPLDQDLLSHIIKSELESRKWKKIVTHNNIGEYGHPHHYQVHIELKSQLENFDNFWVFDKGKEKIPYNILKEKNKILKEVYKSQIDIIEQIRENRGRWFIDKDMETNYIENGIISRYEESSMKEDDFIPCYLK